MIEHAVELLAGAGLGALAGLVFFGGLRWTVQRLAHARRPGALVAGSLLVRLLVLGGLVAWSASRGPVALLGSVAALLAVRGVLLRRVRPRAEEGGRWT